MAPFHDLGRVSSMGDVYANGIGAGIGAVAAALVGASLRWRLVGELAANPRAAPLLTMFFGYRLIPYVPTIDLHKYWHAVLALLTTPNLPPGQFSRYLITWLFIASIIHVLYGPRRFILFFSLLCSAEFIGKALIKDNTLQLNDLLSAGIAWLLWMVLLRRLPGKFSLLAVVFAGMIATERLEPFGFEALPRDFGWIPFASFMQGSIGVNIQAFCQKFYEYRGLIWLLTRIARFSGPAGPWLAPRRLSPPASSPREPGSLPRSRSLRPRPACAIPTPERRLCVRLVARIHGG